jgi:hypothetical protein
MDPFLIGFSGFNLFLALMAAQKAARLLRPSGKERWASRRLYGFAVFVALSLPVVCLGAIGAGWAMNAQSHFAAYVAIASPTGWLLAMGGLFAVVDYLEDGVIGNAIKPR